MSISKKNRRAFQPVSNDWNFYRDLALVWPLILTTFLAISELYDNAAPTRLKVELLAFAGGLLVLAHERRLLVGGIAACFSLYSLYVLLRYQYLPSLAILAVGATVWLIIVKTSSTYRPSYNWPEEIGAFELIVCFTSIVGTFAGWYLLNRYA